MRLLRSLGENQRSAARVVVPQWEYHLARRFSKRCCALAPDAPQTGAAGAAIGRRRWLHRDHIFQSGEHYKVRQPHRLVRGLPISG